MGWKVSSVQDYEPDRIEKLANSPCVSGTDKEQQQQQLYEIKSGLGKKKACWWRIRKKVTKLFRKKMTSKEENNTKKDNTGRLCFKCLECVVPTLRKPFKSDGPQDDIDMVGMTLVVKASQTTSELNSDSQDICLSVMKENTKEESKHEEYNNHDDNDDDDDESLAAVSAISLPEELGEDNEQELSQIVPTNTKTLFCGTYEGEDGQPPPPPPQQQQQQDEKRGIPLLRGPSTKMIMDCAKRVAQSDRRCLRCTHIVSGSIVIGDKASIVRDGSSTSLVSGAF